MTSNGPTLRVWQSEALGRFLRNSDDFLAVATPGAGKTTFALIAAQQLMTRGEISRIIVVVPTTHLRKQWSEAAAKLGIHLDHKFINNNKTIADDMDGAAVAYATVAKKPQLWRDLAMQAKTLVILDEIHHAGEADNLTWGPALRTAFEPAARRLLLSGTPFRSDGRGIPFVTYENGSCVPSFNYDYGQALTDREVVRPIAFPALDGQMRWRDAGSIVSTTLTTATDKQIARALATAFDPEGAWIRSVLSRADQELGRLREDVPDAGALVVASGQDEARAYAQILHQLTGEVPTVAISDEPEASALITEFGKGTSRWIVAVQMVSEGVDIPRLAVGVYASRVSTKMFFRQVVGRFVRMRSPLDETTATLFIPSVEPLLTYAREIERTVDAVLQDEEEELRKRTRGPRQASFNFDLVEPIDSSQATHHATIYSGQAYGNAELEHARKIIADSGMPAAVTAEQMAKALRAAGSGRVVGTATMSVTTLDELPTPTLADEKARLRKLIHRKVGRLHRAGGEEHIVINGRLNRACDDKVTTATSESLNLRLEMLDRWLGEL